MRLFEILDQLNQKDGEQGSANCGVCNEIVAVDMKGHNGTVTIGVPGNVAQDLIINPEQYRAMLVIVNLDEYNKIKANHE